MFFININKLTELCKIRNNFLKHFPIIIVVAVQSSHNQRRNLIGY